MAGRREKLRHVGISPEYRGFTPDGLASGDAIDMTVDELNSKLAELKQELFNLRFQHAVNQLENPKRLQAVKKDIARVKTFIRKQESNVQ